MNRYLETTDGNLVINETIMVSPENTFVYLGGGEITIDAVPLNRDQIVKRLVQFSINNKTTNFVNINTKKVVDVSFIIEMIYL